MRISDWSSDVCSSDLVELAVVIGSPARCVSIDEAMSYIAGYSIGLDMTVRGTEDRSFRKSGDCFAVLGPWLTTADEIADPDDLLLSFSVNGEKRQEASTREMPVGDRQSVGEGKGVSVRVDMGGRRSNKKK